MVRSFVIIPTFFMALEIGLFAYMIISPIIDGGVFGQALIAVISGIGAIVAQISSIKKLRTIADTKDDIGQ